MGRGEMTISRELLVDLLHMPSGTIIVGAKTDLFRDVVFTVEHSDIPANNGTLVQLAPTFQKQDSIVFNGWGADVTVAVGE